MPGSSYWVNVTLCLGFHVQVSGSVLFKRCCRVVTENRDLSRIAFAPLIPNFYNSKLSIKTWSLTSSVWAVPKHHLSRLPWLVVRVCSGARGTSRPLKVTCNPPSCSQSEAQATASGSLGACQQGNPRTPSYSPTRRSTPTWQPQMAGCY